MEVEANVYVEDVDMEDVETSLRKNLKQLQKLPRNVVLAYAGFWGMAYDEAKTLVDRSREIFEQAEDKGEKVEAEARERVRKVYKRAETEVEDEFQEQVGEVLDEMDVPTQTRVNQLGRKIDALDRKLDRIVLQETGVGQEVGRLEAVTEKRLVVLEEKLDRLAQKVEQVILMEAEEEVKEPLPGYDELTAREIVKQLPRLTISQLVAVRQYELTRENRVTILRAVDERVEAMPIPHYDELTVEEIEPLLPTLDAAELAYLAEYEAAHEDRVTLLRAVQDELEERPEA